VRPAGGHFHLLAQIKVTKAKCLKYTFGRLQWQESSVDDGRRELEVRRVV
jgi:hypothetical protein